MKKRFWGAALAAAMILAALPGCSFPWDKVTVTILEGTVLDQTGDTLLVRQDGGDSPRYSFSLSQAELEDGEGNALAPGDFTPGSRVEFGYEGEARPGDPAQVDVTRAELLSPGVSFRGTVLERYESSLLVEADEDAPVRNSSDQFIMGLSEAVLKNVEEENLEAADFLPGSRVEIFFDGYVRESYPAQIDAARVILLAGPETGTETQLPNPMAAYDTPDFTDEAGFAITALPQVEDMTLENCWLIGGTVAQLDYKIELGIEAAFRVAVDTGEDITGVYLDSWEEDVTSDMDGVPVRHRASAGGPALVTWSKNGYAFSLYFPHSPMGMAGGLTPNFLEEVALSPELAPGYVPVYNG